MRNKQEEGQASVFIILAIGIVLLGAAGIAVDVAHLYAQRQMAQAAADAAAQAAVLDIFAGTSSLGTTSFNCTNGTDTRIPCAYARLNKFGLSGSSDTVAVDFPSSVSGVALSPDYTTAAVRVKITRPVTTTFAQLLGISSLGGTAAGTAAIVQVLSPVPILVLHPSLPASMSLGGTPHIQICGGPQRSIQVNSTNSGAVNVGGTATVDLSKGGPADTAGNCTSGTGTDLGAFGGPASAGLPSWMTPTGTTEHYLQPSPPINDPLSGVPYPPRPSVNGTRTTAISWHGCTGTSSKPCALYTPGLYVGGINSKNETAVFSPGIYWIDDDATGKSDGFTSGANSQMMMCTDCGTDTSSHGTGNAGMLVYIHHKGTFDVGANGSVNLLGSDFGSDYKGILFFEDRGAPANTGTSGAHKIGGGGDLALQGTIYVTNTTMTSSTYQELVITGSGTNSTLIKGEIITSVLTLKGGGVIRMQLDPSQVLPLDQVALVN